MPRKSAPTKAAADNRLMRRSNSVKTQSPVTDGDRLGRPRITRTYSPFLDSPQQLRSSGRRWSLVRDSHASLGADMESVRKALWFMEGGSEARCRSTNCPRPLNIPLPLRPCIRGGDRPVRDAVHARPAIERGGARACEWWP